jgi:glyoxylase-like metal-dependent hydrolase (beta-lactamase superfamily II)
VYLLTDPKEGAIMIDAGSGADSDQIFSNMVNDGYDPSDVKYLFVTHCHADHASGATDIKSKTSCEVISSIQEAPFVEQAPPSDGVRARKKSLFYPEDFKRKYCKVDRALGDKETIEFGKCTITSVILPGHSYGVLCLLVELGKKRAFFSSDAVFVGGAIGLGNWPGCELRTYRENIDKVTGLNVDQLFPGHYLWKIRDGQADLDKAADNLSREWIPPMGGHSHPIY